MLGNMASARFLQSPFQRMKPWCLSFIVVISMVAAEQATPTTNPTDLQVLHETMYAMSFEYDWGTLFPDPCVSGPQGIVCEPDAVTGVLFVTQLQFGVLSAIDNIISCSANATIPSSIANLSRLTTLSFTACFTAQTTTMPTSLPLSLRLLTFTSNPALVGAIPSSLGDLTSLQRLVLSQNSLQGEIPGELGGLHSLIQVDLSHNKLSGSIPDSFGAMEGLVNLDLRWNNLQGEFPVSVSQGLHQLQRLALSNNKISSLLPDTFTGLGSLTFMDLSWNELSGALPPSLGSLSRLEDLFVNSNRLNGTIPGSLGELTRLVRLDLSACAFEGTIPDSFHQLESLRFLSVSRNRLSGAIPGSLGLLPVIFTLNLDGNQLSGPVPFSPSFVQKMGRNLLVKDNPGLCYTPHVLLGLDLCPDVVVAESPSAALGSPNGGSFSRGVSSAFVCVMAMICCLVM